jgi:cytoskeletal protein RodZ
MQKIGNIQEESTRSVLIDELLKVLGFIVVLLVGFLVLHNSLQGSQSASSKDSAAQSASSASAQSNQYSILSPATVPSKVAECSELLTFNSADDPGPVTCANGQLNVKEWNALATLEPTVLSLGYNATTAQVQSALCADVNATLSDANTDNSSIVEATVYQIAALYYGWNFPSNPSAALTNGTCG